MHEIVLSVTRLLQTIKASLEQNALLNAFYVKGEISNFTAHHNGHWYFSLKDEQARIQCVMFQSYAKMVAFKPQEGMKVLLKASVSVYPVQGQLQCSVFSMESDGVGDLYLQFEQLKKRLHEVGLFDVKHKKSIPKYPMRIGIITGKNTAALQDMIETCRKRWPLARLSIYSSLVQGDLAVNNLIQQLKNADSKSYDVMLLARGGGSIEDLWAFNSEALAKTLYDLKTPLITGIGHETDMTIADMVADLRAPTPTGAMQFATPDIQDVRRHIQQEGSSLQKVMHNILQNRQYQLSLAKNHRLFRQPEALFIHHQLALTQMHQGLIRQKRIIEQERHGLNRLTQKLIAAQRTNFDPLKIKLHQFESKLLYSQRDLISSSKQQFSKALSLLNAYSPLAILSRGYSIVSQNKQVVNSIHRVSINETLSIYLQDGTVEAIATKKGEHHDTKEKL